MITIDGQKMARSLHNFITLKELFTGSHEKLERGYTPMNIRFFLLQAHYRSTLDFSNEALQASEKGLHKLLKAIENLDRIQAGKQSTLSVVPVIEKCFEALNDDLNTPIAIAQLFEGVRLINLLLEGKETLDPTDLERFSTFMKNICYEVLGLQPLEQSLTHDSAEEGLLQILVDLRLDARKNKDFATSDLIRDKLSELGIALKDTKEGTTWERIG